ncbi:GGDEF domain-containing protein [Shewanella eurypsychrophilus]|uniref:diguanylate cyclase n=1 Tax=Shewanella eurypsychrophilus TaxID=2593656 RepID=A0ABX6V867_9GAMM|nr:MULTISPECIES: GGDEF domain-containing protein [Shewanella]QFU23633.1 diguanylate cyclase [Shewanella sp. YLB-09]QPG58855.1 GGDEF domain-containing protein [Shewanella eurypsychrophilus]
MDSFQWDSHYVTGLDDVDEQHFKLVSLINRFGRQIVRDELVLADIEGVLGELWDYTQNHFSDEELLMTHKGVDERHIKEQIKEHQYFLNEILSYQASISIQDRDTLKSLLKFLTQWLAFHILGADQNMAKQITAIDSGMTPMQAYRLEQTQTSNATTPLLTALNSLFEQVCDQNQQLKILNHSLEDKVNARTQALIDANKHLEKLSNTDSLTGLFNRRYAMEQLSQLWGQSQHEQHTLACILIDADDFKSVNDTFGHDAGDIVLCELARHLTHHLRTDDLICRLGGDEFIVISPNTQLSDIKQLAAKLHDEIANIKIALGEHYWLSSISVGVAVQTPHMAHYHDLIKQADKSLYQAKAREICIA